MTSAGQRLTVVTVAPPRPPEQRLARRNKAQAENGPSGTPTARRLPLQPGKVVESGSAVRRAAVGR